jgi:hypothetical protein
VIRYSLLVLAFSVATATAQPLQFGPAARVARFSPGASGGDYLGVVAPRANGFVSYWQRGGELWSESLSGSPPRPDLATAHSEGVNVDAVAETANGPIVLYTDGSSTFVRALHAPAPAATLVSAGYPDGIECNSTRCLVSIDNGNTLAIVDTNAQLIKLVPPLVRAHFRVAWATDPGGFLMLLTADDGSHAISIDNGGSLRAGVKIDPLNFAAATFHGDRYAVFMNSAAGLTAFTMTVDGQLPSPKRVISATPLQPLVVAWNGSEDLLAGFSGPVGGIPEIVPTNALSGLRIGPDLSPLDAQPFQIAPPDGANYATSIAWNGSMFYVVWTHTPSTPLPFSTAVEGAAVSATGSVVTRDLQSWGSVPQTRPRVAQGSTAPIVVWSEFDAQSGTAALRYARSGQVFTVATGFAIDAVPLGDDYLVAWTDAGRTRAAVLTYGLSWSEVSLPALNNTNVAVAANHDHWLIAGAVASNLVSIAISRDGSVSPPKVVADLPYLLSLASDGDRFFLAAPGHDFILDAAGSPVIDRLTQRAAMEVDFAGGVYGALGGSSTFDRYDRDGNFIGSTKYSVAGGEDYLSHIGSRFVIVDANNGAPLANVVGSDGTLLAQDVRVPAVLIARTDSTTSTAVNPSYATDTWGQMIPALFVETVELVDARPHRSVKH